MGPQKQQDRVAKNKMVALLCVTSQSLLASLGSSFADDKHFLGALIKALSLPSVLFPTMLMAFQLEPKTKTKNKNYDVL